MTICDRLMTIGTFFWTTLIDTAPRSRFDHPAAMFALQSQQQNGDRNIIFLAVKFYTVYQLYHRQPSGVESRGGLFLRPGVIETGVNRGVAQRWAIGSLPRDFRQNFHNFLTLYNSLSLLRDS
ncbi:MAG: hypothetical protein ACRC8Y_20580, partial [Chroococcales cyanobacterium]